MSARPFDQAEPAPGARTATTTLEVVIPVFNEERDLAASVLRVRRYLTTLPWIFRVTIADNIPTLFGPASLHAWTRLALANAIVFKGSWTGNFVDTKVEPFGLGNGDAVQYEQRLMLIDTSGGE